MAFQVITKIGDREVTIYELTVRQVRDMAKSQAISHDDPLGQWLIEDAPLGVLAAMSSLTETEMEEWRPSELKQLRNKVKEVNPDFFSMSQRLNDLLRQVTPSDVSTKPSLPLQK